MTNIQAIDLLKGLEQSLDDYCELNDEGKTAFRMAITALELFGNSEQLPSIQPDTTTHDSIPAETGKIDDDGTSGDCISRQQAIDEIHEDADWLASQGSDWQVERMERDKSILMSLPSVQPETNCSEIPNNWIPCSEQLPEKEGWYITTVESEKTGKRRIENDLFAVDIALAHGHTPNKFCKDGYRQRTVAWMPFPEPYQKRGDQDGMEK